MKVIDKIGPDGCVYIIKVDINDVDVEDTYLGDGLRAIFGHIEHKDIGDSLTNNELSSGAKYFWVKQVFTPDGKFVYEHTKLNGVRANVLIAYSHLLPQQEYQIIYNSELLQERHGKDMKIHKESMEKLLKDLMRNNDYLAKKMEHYETKREWDVF